MIDGTYRMEIDSPLGHKRGTVTMRTEGNVVYADIDAPIIGKVTSQGHVDGDNVSGEGMFKLGLFGKVSYKLQGRVEGDKLHITINTNKGTITAEGTRI